VTRIGIILGSTRPNRNGEQVARWVYDIASRRSDAEYELVDLRDYPLPHLDEPLPPSMGQYQNDHTKAWADKIASRSASYSACSSWMPPSSSIATRASAQQKSKMKPSKMCWRRTCRPSRRLRRR